MNPSHEPTTDPALPSGVPYPPPPVGPDAGPGWYDDGAIWPPPKPSRRPWQRTVAVVAATLLPIAVLGVPLGLLWQWLAPTVPVVRTAAGELVINDPSPEQFIAADGWFTAVGLVFGIVVAIAAWLIARRDRGPALLLGTVLGALAAAPVAWQVGRRVGLSAYQAWQGTATAGASFDRPPDVHTYAALLVPAFAAVIVCTLLAGWSNDPNLDQPGAKPGYGNYDGARYPRDGQPYPAEPQLSWGSPAGPDPTAAPAPPAPGSAAPPRG